MLQDDRETFEFQGAKLDRLVGDLEIPDPTLLLKEQYQEVVSDLARWFKARHPRAPTGRRRFFSDPIEARDWLSERLKVPPSEAERLALRPAAYDARERQVLLFPSLLHDLQSHEAKRRLQASVTILDEFIHAARPYPRINSYIEEGSTSLYTIFLTQQAFGLNYPTQEKLLLFSYEERVEAVSAILSSFVDTPAAFWLAVQRLRTRKDAPAWLKRELLKRQDPKLIERLYKREPEVLESEWLALTRELKGVRHDLKPAAQLP